MSLFTGFARCDENDDECSDVDFDSVQETYSACCQTVFAKNCRDSVSNKSKEEFRGIIRNLEKKIEQLRKSGGTQDEIDTNLRQLRLFEERLMGNFIKGLHDLFKSKQILNVVDGGELDKFGIGSRARSHTKNAQQPPAAVNFQLQLQLHIESGLAILHPDIFCEKLEDTGATLSQQKKRMRDEQERSEFELPGILVNAKYSSVYPETFDLCGHGEFFQGRYANLYCQCFVQSMSNCMMLNPQVLDFFDRMIEGMRKPDDRKPQTTTSASVLSVEDPKTPPFFMNVVVSVAIEPSIILLTCHPHSRMECELRSPSIDFVFTRTAPVEQKQLLRFKRKGESAGLASNSIFHCSVRAKDFRVKIYHPYVSTRIPSVGVSHDRSDGNTASSRIKAGALSRSALVLSVSSALCNIGRFRNVSYSGSCIEQDVHVAAVFRIGKSSFDYDVRKLQEILCFPRAWYNKSLMRKLFIGDEGRRESKNITPNTTSGANNCWCTRVSFTGCIEQVHINMKMSNIMGIVSWLTQQLHTIGSIRLDSYHNREIDIETYFESSRFVAEQGIIGGKSEIVDMWVRFLTNEKRPRVADYALKANLDHSF
ncbi:hypothetical protein ACOME3_008729 [Neoechinorhynchus agilis]